MRYWLALLGTLTVAVSCTANDGTSRSSFYRAGTVGGSTAQGGTGGGAQGGTGGAAPACQTDADCAAGQICLGVDCYGVITCGNSLNCTAVSTTLTICDTSTGQCVGCLAPTDCDGGTCANRACTP